MTKGVLTNDEAIGLASHFSRMINEYFDKDSKKELTQKVYHAIKRSLRILKEASNELNEIQKDIQEVFKKVDGFEDADLQDQEKAKAINKRFVEWTSNPLNIAAKTDFLAADFNHELFKVSEGEITACIVDERDDALLMMYLCIDK